MIWKQIKIFTADAEQSVVIEPNPEKDGMVMHSIEEHDNESFMLHMTFEEAETIGQELIKYAEEMKSNVVGQSEELSLSDFRVGFEYEELQMDSERYLNKGMIWVKKTYGLNSPRLHKIQKLLEEGKLRKA
tara:strand:+ start:1846 stop:2238 length:393 start_codon:yes stop_codon:yes gene_type:complete